MITRQRSLCAIDECTHKAGATFLLIYGKSVAPVLALYAKLLTQP